MEVEAVEVTKRNYKKIYEFLKCLGKNVTIETGCDEIAIEETSGDRDYAGGPDKTHILFGRIFAVSKNGVQCCFRKKDFKLEYKKINH